MRNVQRSALVPYSTQQMFALVADISKYSEFVPWCSDATIHAEYDEVTEASLAFSRGTLQKSFTTRNRATPYESIKMELLGGPFRALSGGWTFDALGDSGCKVSLTLEFEFENALTDRLFGSFFEEVCNRMIDSFITRADNVYGPTQ